MASIYKNGETVGFVRFYKPLQQLIRGFVRDPMGTVRLHIEQIEDRQTEERSWRVTTGWPDFKELGRGKTRKAACAAAGYELR